MPWLNDKIRIVDRVQGQGNAGGDLDDGGEVEDPAEEADPAGKETHHPPPLRARRKRRPVVHAAS